jgi:aminoglycoside phosphotransferase (APT) family kinase protein
LTEAQTPLRERPRRGPTGVMPDDRWPATPRFDPAAVLRRLAAAGHAVPAVEGPLPGGEVGGAYVRWPDGRRGVLTAGNPAGVRAARWARAAGLPVAEVQLAADAGAHFAVVQERLPGTLPERVDDRLVDGLRGLNRRMAGLLADRADLPPVPLHLTRGGPGFCLHEPLAGYDRRTARLLAAVREIGAARDVADGPDLVHLDFHPGNVLVHEGRISGVVDWDGAGRGDGRLDLVTLRFDLALRSPRHGDALAEELRAAVPPDRLRAYQAHMALRLVDWAIRHHGAEEVAFWLDVAERDLGIGPGRG